ncbi:MAG: hypothetical protein IJS53_01010, partial [Clostridia bacterium]|nr:hypothetical protein [Clostridia bacterium]
MKKGNHWTARRLLAALIAALTLAAQTALPAGAQNASASGDETLGRAARPALTVDLSRLLGISGAKTENAGRVLVPGGAAVGVAIATK